MSSGRLGMDLLKVMRDADAESIHLTSLDLLERMGVKVVSGEARTLLRDAGAEVDEKSQVARIPRDIVTESIRRCQRPVRMCARNPKNDFVLDGEHVYACTDGVGLATIDLETGQRRPSTKKDVEDSARIVDSLEYMNMYNPLVTPLEVPKHAHSLHEVEASFNNCEKHVTPGATYTKEEAEYQLRMAAAIVGGRE